MATTADAPLFVGYFGYVAPEPIEDLLGIARSPPADRLVC